MGIHPSLKVDPSTAQQRSVLSRIERIKDLMRKGLWEQGRSVTGLPKVKVVKIKAKKAAKTAEAATPEAAGAAKAPGTPAATAAPAAKSAAKAK